MNRNYKENCNKQNRKDITMNHKTSRISGKTLKKPKNNRDKRHRNHITKKLYKKTFQIKEGYHYGATRRLKINKEMKSKKYNNIAI